MIVTYHPHEPRPLAQYLSSGRLSAVAYDALAAAKMSGRPCELAVIGEYVPEDGKSWLDYGATTAYIEAVTDYRYDHDARRLRLLCPECGLKDGKHSRSCERR